MPEAICMRIVEVLAETLEQMAFVSVAPPADGTPPPKCPLLLRIGFRGPICQRVEMLVDEGLGALMASNMMGDDCADAAFRSRDALKELLNVTCGALLRQEAEAGNLYQMSIPEVTPLSAEEWNSLLAEGDFELLDAEGHPLAIRVADRK